MRLSFVWRQDLKKKGTWPSCTRFPRNPQWCRIEGGELKEYIAAGTSSDVFLQRLRKALQPTQDIPQSAASSSPSGCFWQLARASHGRCLHGSIWRDQPGEATPSSTGSNGNEATEQVQSLLTERATRLEAQRKEDAEEAKRRRIEKGKAKPGRACCWSRQEERSAK